MAGLKKCVIFSLAFIITALMCPGLCASAASTAVVADFSDGITAEKFKLESSGEQTLSGEYSAKWVVGSPKQTTQYTDIPTDWSAYKYLNIWVYSDSASGSKINIVVNTDTNSRSFFLYYLKLDFTGWTQVSIPLEDFMPQYNASWDSNVKSIYFNSNGWKDSNYNPVESITDPLYFDLIWLTAPSDTEPDDGGGYDESADGIYTLCDFYDEKSIESAGTALKADYDVKNMYDISAKWANHTENQGWQIEFEPMDIGVYQNLNMNIYSEVANNDKINVVIYTNEGDMTYRWFQIPIDFTGWKTLSLTLSASTSGNGGSFKGARVLQLSANGWGLSANPETVLNFEKIWFSKSALKEFSVTGYENTVSADGTAEIEFSNILPKKIKDGAVTLLDKDGNEIAAKYTTYGKTLKVKPNSRLEFNSEYTVRFNDGFCDGFGQKAEEMNPVSFKTTSKDYICESFTLKNAAGREIENLPVSGSINISSKVYNPFDEEKNIEFVVGTYDASGKMTDITTTEYSLLPEEETDIGADLSGSFLDKTVSAFVRDESGLPIGGFSSFSCSDKALYTGSSILSAKLSKPAAEVESDKVTFGGTAENAAFVTINVTDENGISVYLRPVSLKDGEYRAETVFDGENAANGKYTVSVGAYGSGNLSTSEFYYANAEKRDELLQSIKNSSEEELKKLFENEYMYFGTGKEKSGLFAEVIKRLAVSDSYENVTAAVRKAKTLLEKINSSGWNTLGETMVSESTFLGLSSEIGEFSGFGEAAQNEIANYMASDMPFGDFKEIKASLINAIKKYNDNRRKNESGSGGGSGSGGSGKSISVTPVTPVITNPSTPQEEYRFADLADAEWAEESIYALVKKGILSKPEDKRFNPMSDITREEAVKIIVEAFYEVDNSAECSFNDVSENDWFYPYVATAVKLGIANGEGESFGTGKSITRQDLAVMAYRAAKLAEAENAAAFDDDGEISDYAKSAVYCMKEKNIISGTGGNRFSPLNSCTRAETAKIIYGLINIGEAAR